MNSERRSQQSRQHTQADIYRERTEMVEKEKTWYRGMAQEELGRRKERIDVESRSS